MKYLSLMAFILASVSGSAFAQDSYTLILKDNQFSPKVLEIPAQKKVKLTVENHDKTPAEFESHDLKLEKIITGGGKAVMYIRPLKAGTYHFFDEFHEKTTRGKVIVK